MHVVSLCLYEREDGTSEARAKKGQKEAPHSQSTPDMPGGDFAFDLFTPDEYVLLGMTTLTLISLIHHMVFEAFSADDGATRTAASAALPRKPLVPISEFQDADTADADWMQKAPRPPPPRRPSEDVLFSASAAAYQEAAQQTGGDKGGSFLQNFTRTKTRKQERRQEQRANDVDVATIGSIGMSLFGGRRSASRRSQSPGAARV